MMVVLFSWGPVLGFIVGALAVIAVEVIGIVLLFRRINRTSSDKSLQSSSVVSSLHLPSHSISSLYQKQGVVWILEPEKIPKISVSAEQGRKREVLEVSPVRKVAKVKDRTLFLTEADGSSTKILLKGCQVLAVSATSLPSKKWAKRYPIKVESKTAALYHGSRILYLYAETCCEKESWCKALRVASSDDKERLFWLSKLNEDFRSYLRSLTEGYPSLIKPSVSYRASSQDKANRLDDPASKVRQLWKKLSKKGSSSSHDEKRVADKHTLPDLVSVQSTRKVPNVSVEESSVRSSASTHSANSDITDAGGAENFIVDEGTLCWNLIVSRLFFDAKNNAAIKNSLKARIQRTLSNMRTPSYIGEVICTDLDPGNLPPYIQSMRAVPTDMNDLWALEMDVEYSGGIVLYIEARLEVGELDAQNGMAESNIDASSNGEVTTDFLDNIKQVDKELKLSDGAFESTEKKNAGDTKFDKLRSSKIGMSTAAPGSRWKSLLNSVAKHVNQVPLTLAIRVPAFKGTFQLYIKPPPSDQLWFGFTSMPDINFELESSVKDHKITYGRVAQFLINRFKAAIQETLVLPNCESACVPWMLAEEDDWIPCSDAPLIWISREVPSDATTSPEVSNTDNGDRKAGDRDQETKQAGVRQTKIDPVKQPYHEDDSGVASPSSVRRCYSDSNVAPNDVRAPLLQNEVVTQDTAIVKKEDNPNPNPASQSPSRYVSLKEQRNSDLDEDGKPKKAGRKARMFDLGKRMVEKIEEKRRHIEEKGRHTVDKIRGHEVG